MKKYLMILNIFIIAVLFTACKTGNKEMTNPLLSESKTPFGVPPFNEIIAAHFLPALDSTITINKLEIEAIIANPEPATFDNTLKVLDLSGKLLDNVSAVFFGLNSADGTDDLQAISGDMRAKLSQHADDISMNGKLFERVKQVYENRGSLNLNTEQLSLLDNYYKMFLRNGVNLPDKEKERLREINLRLTELTTRFDQNLLAETNDFKLIIETQDDLAGLPDDVIAGAASAAKEMGLDGKWVFTTHKPSMIPFLQYSQRKDLRKKIYDAYCNRANNNNEYDNKEIIAEIANLRIEKANLLGFPSFAAYQLDDRMAKTPAAVYELLDNVWEKAIAVAKKERDEMQAIIDAEGGNFRLAAEDWWYYAEKLRKQKYNLDENEVRPYLELNNVVNGVFTVSKKLYGCDFKKITSEFPKPHPLAEVFEVTDADGSHLGILYMDYFTRPTKAQGAWCGSYRKQYRTGKEEIRPVVTIVTNFANPVGDNPVLLSLDEALTLFHEFGHGLHNLLSDVTYKSIAGTSVKRDFVELPSQIMENWATQKEVLQMYARHYKTGEIIPDELIEKLQNAEYFNQGFATVEYVAASYLDMNYHMLTQKEKLDIVRFENEYLQSIGLIHEIVPRYRSTYFKHIWSSGYSAGYYSYIWAEVLDKDAFGAFLDNGLFDKTTADAFRDYILSRGGSMDPMELYIKFRGREPAIEPLLKSRGML
ncbi:MAG: M3 family metallopeptidase [Bacteroidales bacterium]|nr:M3 family metallopeptidase [Bacteroidales bacterium]